MGEDGDLGALVGQDFVSPVRWVSIGVVEVSWAVESKVFEWRLL